MWIVFDEQEHIYDTFKTRRTAFKKLQAQEDMKNGQLVCYDYRKESIISKKVL